MKEAVPATVLLLLALVTIYFDLATTNHPPGETRDSGTTSISRNADLAYSESPYSD
jgi:hypothetical protein